MPELPDVEVYRRRLEDAHFQGEIAEVSVDDERVLDRLSPAELTEAVQGRRIADSRRHGKLMVAGLSGGGALVFHFGMTGALAAVEAGAEPPKYARVLFGFDDGRRLAYISRRKLGHVGYAEDAGEPARQEKLGPDALAVDSQGFRKALEGKRSAVKTFLMDQSALAGIGNVYSDEILYQAGLHPKTPTSDLGGDSVDRLYETMRRVLQEAVDLGAGSEDFADRAPNDWLLPHRTKGEACPRCGGKVRQIKISGRTGWMCPKCQPGPG